MLCLEGLLQTKLPRPTYLDYATEENDYAVGFKPESEPDDLPTAREGRRQLLAHYRIERDRSLVEKKKDAVREATGGLACEVCNFDFRIYKRLGEGFCEVHHLRPLSEEISTVETSLDDLAIVCANCHRMIHRTGHAMSLSSVRASLES
jgi:5-methylcytosine-specific restriction enzyme A